MKHIVTISLVFFSLTHLAKAERVEGLRFLTERYCAKQQVTATVTQAPGQQDDHLNPFFFTYSELTLVGAHPAKLALKHRANNQVVAHLTIRRNPNNNSP